MSAGRPQVTDFRPEHLALLSEIEREAVALRLEHLSATAIAQRLGKNVEAVKNSLYRARKRLGLPNGHAIRIVGKRTEVMPRVRFTRADMETLPKWMQPYVSLLLDGLLPSAIAERLGVKRESVMSTLRQAHSLLGRAVPPKPAPVVVPKPAGPPRCKCGLLLPCNGCVGRAEDYSRYGTDGEAAFSGWRAIR